MNLEGPLAIGLFRLLSGILLLPEHDDVQVENIVARLLEPHAPTLVQNLVEPDSHGIPPVGTLREINPRRRVSGLRTNWTRRVRTRVDGLLTEQVHAVPVAAEVLDDARGKLEPRAQSAALEEDVGVPEVRREHLLIIPHF